MKKVFSYITIFVLLLAIFSPFVVYGQTPATPPSVAETVKDNLLPGQSFFKQYGGTLVGFAWDNILTGIILPFAYLILQLMSLLLWASGYLLDKVIEITVVTFSDNINKIEGIKTVWVVMRDLMNIGFIFLLIFEGMKKILGLGGDAKKLVIGIILTSLLLNFSLLVTKVIIDASNIVTIGFYKSIVSGTNADLTTTIDNKDSSGTGIALDKNTGGLSSAFMNTLDVTSFFRKDSINKVAGDLSDGGRTSRIILVLFGALIFLTVAIAFIAVSAMFLIRYITLIILMVLSPIAFMGYAFPSIKSSQSDWWKTLMGQCLFGPIYMFMTWVTLVLATGIIPRTNDISGWAGLVNGKGANIVLVINLAVVLGLVIMSISMAKKYATAGSSMLGTATNWLTAAAGGVLMGGVAGGVLRNTVGRGAGLIAENKKLQEAAATGSGFKGLGARALLKTAKKGNESTFDLRRSSVGEQIQKQTGVNLGKGIPFNEKFAEGGIAGIKERKLEKKKKEGDVVLKKYRNKPEVLATYLTSTDVIGRERAAQKYIYEKLSPRERDAFEREVAKQNPGDAGNEIIKKMREGLSREDQLEAVIRRNKNNQTAFAEEFAKIDEEKDQQFIYEKLSARNRVALDQEVSKLPADPLKVKNATDGTDLRNKMRASLSQEEREKTEKEEREAEGKQKFKQAIDDINKLSLPTIPTGSTGPTPGATLDTLIGPVGGKGPKLPAKQARNLSSDAIKNPEVIKRLSVPHLRDLKANGDLDQAEIDEIIAVINNTAAPYASQAAHKAYISQPAEVGYWT